MEDKGPSAMDGGSHTHSADDSLRDGVAARSFPGFLTLHLWWQRGDRVSCLMHVYVQIQALFRASVGMVETCPTALLYGLPGVFDLSMFWIAKLSLSWYHQQSRLCVLCTSIQAHLSASRTWLF